MSSPIAYNPYGVFHARMWSPLSFLVGSFLRPNAIFSSSGGEDPSEVMGEILRREICRTPGKSFHFFRSSQDQLVFLLPPRSGISETGLFRSVDRSLSPPEFCGCSEIPFLFKRSLLWRENMGEAFLSPPAKGKTRRKAVYVPLSPTHAV